MLHTDLENEINAATSDFAGEAGRFQMILNRHLAARGLERARLRNVLVEYLAYSPQSTNLINLLIENCIELADPGRLDVAVDVLCELGDSIFDYAFSFMVADIKNFNHLYAGRRTYQPSDDHWYIMLRSVARSTTDEARKLSLLKMCRGSSYRGIHEAVVESLADIGSDNAIELLKQYASHDDPFIARLASDSLEEV